MSTQWRIPIGLEESAGHARELEPVRFGVPLPKGALRRADDAMLIDAKGRALPMQARLLAAWSDRSVKWLLVDALATAQPHERSQVFLCPRDATAPAAAPAGMRIRVTERGGARIIDTGVASFVVGENPAALLDAVRLRESDLLDASGACLSLTGCRRDYRALTQRTRLEEQGPVRVDFVAEGHFLPVDTSTARSPRSVLRLQARLIFIAGSSAVHLEVLLHNPRAARHPGGLWDLDDRGTLLFEDVSLSLRPAHPARAIKWYAERPAEPHIEAPADWSLYQDSSGGENWDSDNHIDGAGAATVSFRGYRVTYRTERGATQIAEGDRASPCVSVVTDAGTISATTREFWQNFPKALRWRDGSLDVSLFPEESRAPFALQGGEQKRHSVVLEFAPPGAESTVPGLQRPLEISVDPDWIERSGAIEHFTSVARDPNGEYLRYVGSIVEGPHSFAGKRERIDEYGWRHFGDLYADHENVRHSGPRPLVSHYNNQYDFIYGSLVHFLRTGDRRWWRLADPAARHTIDIDIYHTDEDRVAFNHGHFWHTDHYRPAATSTHRTYSRRNGRASSYGGGPSNEHNYTSGLTLYYYLSGDPEAALAVRELADWVIAMDGGIGDASGNIDSEVTGLASKTVDPSYHKAGRGAGNSINALLDAWQLSTERKYLDKAEELIRRCIHPADDIDGLCLAEPELRWSYLVFLQVLGKYLHLKLEWDEIDGEFHHARASLLHYARWMSLHEVPYKDVLHKVHIPTETWPAHDMRKCHVLHVAAEFAPAEARASLHERAAFFFERCLTDVLGFETAYLTRPLVILCVCGFVHSYYQNHPDAGHEIDTAPLSFGSPQPFAAKRKSRLTALLARARVRLVRAGLERLDIFGRYSTPSRL